MICKKNIQTALFSIIVVTISCLLSYCKTTVQDNNTTNIININDIKDSILCGESSSYVKEFPNSTKVIMKYNVPSFFNNKKTADRKFNSIIIDSLLIGEISMITEGKFIKKEQGNLKNYVLQHKKIIEDGVCNFSSTEPWGRIDFGCHSIDYNLGYNNNNIVSYILYYVCGIKEYRTIHLFNFNFSTEKLITIEELIDAKRKNDFIIVLDERFQKFKIEYKKVLTQQLIDEQEENVVVTSKFTIHDDEQIDTNTFNKFYFQFITKEGDNGIEFYHPKYHNNYENPAPETTNFFFTFNELKPFLTKDLVKQLKI